MKLSLFIFLLATIISLSFPVRSQPLSRYNTFNYTVNEGLLQSTVIDVAFDRNNFCWISFPNGLQIFDGQTFSTISIQPGLPDDKFCRFFKTSAGELWVSHTSGISRYDTKANTFIQTHTFAKRHKQPALFIGQINDSVYIYTGEGVILGLQQHNFSIASKHTVPWGGFENNSDNYPKISNIVENSVVALLINKKIYTWDLKMGKQLSASPKKEEISPYFLHMKNKNELLFYNYSPKGSLQLYNIKNKLIKPLPVKGFENIQLARCNILHWKGKNLISLNNRLFETDSSLSKITKEIVTFQNQPPSGNFTISLVKEDNLGNLLVITIAGGIRKIIRNNYPIKYYNSGESGKNFILSVLPDKQNNRILAGSVMNGLLVFDTLQSLIKHLRITGDKGIPISPNIILKKKNGNYLLFASGEHKVWELDAGLNNIRTFPLHTTNTTDIKTSGYFGSPIYQHSDGAIVQTQNNLYKVNTRTNRVQGTTFSKAYIMAGIFYNGKVLTHGNDELLITDTASFAEIRKIPFPNTGNVRCFAKDNYGNIWLGSNKGIFSTDISGNVNTQYSKLTGLPDECIYAMAFDNENSLWCSTNKGILKLSNGKVIEHLKKEDGLQENEFNTNVLAIASDGEMFFGGVNGISSFFPSQIIQDKDSTQLVFTRITTNNEPPDKNLAPWSITKLELPYNQNSIAFDFVAIGNLNPDQYRYQYRMMGVANDWIPNTGMQTIRYSLLPGKYVFQISASRAFSETAVPMRELLIIIHPPFWKSWWFIISVITLSIILLGYIVNMQSKKQFLRQLQHMEQEKQLKQERERISKDLHDSLGAFANAVLYNSEMLEQEQEEYRKKELLNDLKFASKDIIISLRETVWALKREKYNSEDCMVRIRNFTQSMARYYTRITFSNEGEAPFGLELSYKKALHLVRIVQESVTNSIKHGNPSKITIYSYITDNRWTLKIEDNGTGFEIDNPTTENGNGLANMVSRAAASGFELNILSDIGKGTQVIITI